MTKGSTHQEDIVILTIQAPNNRATKHMKQNHVVLRGELAKFRNRAGGSIGPLWRAAELTKQEMSRSQKELSTTTNQQQLLDMNRMLHPTRRENSHQGAPHNSRKGWASPLDLPQTWAITGNRWGSKLASAVRICLEVQMGRPSCPTWGQTWAELAQPGTRTREQC